jgi:hypothetical protein
MSDDSTSTNGAPPIDPSQVDANELAQNMSQATDEQLTELMSGPMREQILPGHGQRAGADAVHERPPEDRGRHDVRRLLGVPVHDPDGPARRLRIDVEVVGEGALVADSTAR